MSKNPPALEELLSSRKPIRNINLKHLENLSALDRFAVFITSKVGTMGFFGIIFIWTALWLSWNIFGPDQYHFDPYPAFVLWLFISNMIQILLLPLLLIGQNLQGRHAEARAEADFEVNSQAEKEIEAILLHLSHQNLTLKKILESIEYKPRKG